MQPRSNDACPAPTSRNIGETRRRAMAGLCRAPRATAGFSVVLRAPGSSCQSNAYRCFRQKRTSWKNLSSWGVATPQTPWVRGGGCRIQNTPQKSGRGGGGSPPPHGVWGSRPCRSQLFAGFGRFGAEVGPRPLPSGHQLGLIFFRDYFWASSGWGTARRVFPVSYQELCFCVH